MNSLKHYETLFERFPILPMGEDLVLRDPRRRDAADYMRYLNHPSVSPFIPDSCLPSSIEHAERDMQYIRDLYNRRRSFYWSIAKQSDQSLVGTCGFESWVPYHYRAELAYDIDPQYWRRGVATLAVTTILDFAFNRLHIQRVEAFTLPSNEASNACLEKLGFKHEALLRDYRFYKGQFTNILLYALTKDDYMQQRQAYTAMRESALERCRGI